MNRKKFFILIGFTVFSLLLLKGAKAIDISTCSVLNQAGETYYVTTDFVGTSSPCIDMTSSASVTLDCQGHTITGAMINYLIKTGNTGTKKIKNCILSNYWGYPIYSFGTMNLVLENVTISSASVEYAINLESTFGGTFTNITTAASNWAGIYFGGSDNIEVTNMVSTSDGYGIDMTSSSDSNIVKDSIIQDSDVASLRPSGDSNLFYNNLLNSTTNVVSPGSNQWNTTKQLGTRIYSSGPYIGGNYWTNPTGNGFSDTCADADQDGFCDSAYTIDSNNIDYLPLSDEYSDTQAPRYSFNSTNSTLAGSAVEFRLNWTDNILLDSYIFSLDNCTGTFVNDTESSFSPTDIEWTNLTYGINKTSGCTIRWKIYASDYSDNWNTSDTYSFFTTYSLIWESQGSNATGLRLGDAVLLYTNWTSKIFNLSHAILSTNEAGQWRNYTDGTYGSPMSLSGKISWSNFSWSNASITDPIPIGWKIYTNDTNNNWNSTDILWFARLSGIVIPIESSKMASEREIISRPNTNIQITGRAFYSADDSPFASETINFTYDSKSLGSNITDNSGNYQLTFTIPYEGVYTLIANTSDASGNTGQNTTLVRISTSPINVRFKMSYMIGNNKINDVYRIGTSGLVSDTINNLNLMNTQYSNNLTYGYVCTYDQIEYSDGLSLSFIHSGNKPNLNFVNFSATSTSANYILELKQKIENNNLLLTYTKGTCQSIHDKMYLVETYEIPSRPFSSFSYPIPAGVPVLIRFKNDRIQIDGSDRFSAGDHKVCAEKSRISLGGKDMLEVGIC